MVTVVPGRMTAEVDGDFVVFMIGMRINKPWKLHKWIPVMRAMTPGCVNLIWPQHDGPNRPQRGC
jgi:Monooxygenase af470-like